jgi:hypothetical protein
MKVCGVAREDFSTPGWDLTAFHSPSHELRCSKTGYAWTTSPSRSHYNQLISWTWRHWKRNIICSWNSRSNNYKATSQYRIQSPSIKWLRNCQGLQMVILCNIEAVFISALMKVIEDRVSHHGPRIITGPWKKCKWSTYAFKVKVTSILKTEAANCSLSSPFRIHLCCSVSLITLNACELTLFLCMHI